MNRLTILILIAPTLIGSIFGVFIAYHNEFPVTAFSFNFISIVLGIPLAILLGLMQISFQRHLFYVSLLVLALMSASLLSDVSGVHRWIIFGPIYINISMLLSPLILYIINISLGCYKFLPIILLIAVSVIHVLQPDAGQATAFGCAAAVIFFLRKDVPFEIRLIGIISIAITICLCWCQPDSLPAVEYVERILNLAIRIGILGVVGIALSIIALFLPILYTIQQQELSSDTRILAIAFIVYLVVAFCVTRLGNFPVPILGAGASSILGYYIILGFTIIKRDQVLL